MADPVRRKPPLPLTLAFLACHEVYRDERTASDLLVRPSSHVPVTDFPCLVPLSFWAEFTGGHGSYLPAVRLVDDSDDTVWEWTANSPFEETNPLFPHSVTVHGVLVDVPRLGRYSLVLLLNGEEAAQRSMWFGPAHAFKD